MSLSCLTSQLMSQGSLSLARPEGAQTCALAVERGTSMATPVVAGALALIRQYFVDGWYPSGAPQAAASFLPSAPLLKAVLLGAKCWGTWIS